MVDSMRTQLKVLEAVVAAMPLALLDEEFIDQDDHLADAEDDQRGAKKLREYLREAMRLSDDAATIRSANALLSEWVQECELTAATLRSLTKTMIGDNNWAANERRWSTITRALFTPWTMEACQALIEESMRQIDAFSFADGDFETTGINLFGWRDRRKLDRESGALRYSFTRSYAGQDAKMLATRWWNLTLIPERYAQVVLGPNAKLYYEVLQGISPDIFIVRLVEQYPNVPYNTHMLIMHFRLPTRNGFIQVHRSIPCPEIQRATDDENAVWTSNFHWITNDVKTRNDEGICVEVESSLSGTFASPSVEYANRWMVELASHLANTNRLRDCRPEVSPLGCART